MTDETALAAALTPELEAEIREDAADGESCACCRNMNALLAALDASRTALETAHAENKRLRTIARLYAMGHRLQSDRFESCHCWPCEAYNRLLASQPAAKEGTGDGV